MLYINGKSTKCIFVYIYIHILTPPKTSPNITIFTYYHLRTTASGVHISLWAFHNLSIFTDPVQMQKTVWGVSNLESHAHPSKTCKTQGNLTKTKVKMQKTVFRISANSCSKRFGGPKKSILDHRSLLGYIYV